MKQFRMILVASALAAAVPTGMASASPGSSPSVSGIVRAGEISAQRRYAPAVQPRPYRGFADPSFGPDGRPYPVPEYLRNQCHIDMGYGRFQSCSNR